MKSKLFLLGLGLLFLTACGGGNPATYVVKGVVTFDGQPVSGASVSFVPTDGKGKNAAATTGDDGSYTLTTFSANDGAVPGIYAIKVTKYPIQEQADAPPADYGSGDVSLEDQYKAAEQYGGAPKEANRRGKEIKNELPSKYEVARSSGLTYTVTTDAEQTYDIPLTK